MDLARRLARRLSGWLARTSLRARLTAGFLAVALASNGTLDYISEVCFDDVTLVKN